PPRAPYRAGMNRFAWNMRMPDAAGFDGMILWAAGMTGPMVPPGTYTVRLTVAEGGAAQTQTFAIRKDPRSDATPADVQEQFDFLMRIQARTEEANNAVRTIRNLRWQVNDRLGKAGNRSAVDRIAAPMLAQLSAVEEEIYQVRNQSGQDPLNYPIKLNNKIAALAGVVGNAEAKPTKQSYEVFTLLSDELAVQTGKLSAVLTGQLPALNRELERQGLATIVPGTAQVKP
ncbi:MAG TPA: glycosyl hydrolase, partial [Gemmatimonadales bacterium]